MFGSLRDHYQIRTVAERPGPVASHQDPRTVAEVGLADAKGLDMLLLPGGVGTLPELENAALLDFLRGASSGAEVVMSVC